MKIFAAILLLVFSFNQVFAHTCATWIRLSDKEHSQKLQEDR